jgi:hypothetical protein
VLWVVAYRGEGERIGRRIARGRAAAVVAAAAMIDHGLEVISVTAEGESKAVSTAEIRRIRALRHAPHLAELGVGRRISRG